MLHLFIGYFVVNLIATHVHTRRRIFETPKVIEAVVYLLVMLVAGFPLVAVLMLLRHESGIEGYCEFLC